MSCRAPGFPPRTRPHVRGWVAAISVVVALMLTACGAESVLHSHSVGRPPFPTVDTTNLSPTRARLIQVLAREYTSNPASEKYTGGVSEPWCADFVTWVLNDAGVPLSNPNSGSWRIPGTATLREFYEGHNRFRPVGSGYAPQPGDVAIYDDPGSFGEHTNMVVRGTATSMMTVGGNEPGGIRLVADVDVAGSGLVGFGVPAE